MEGFLVPVTDYGEYTKDAARDSMSAISCQLEQFSLLTSTGHLSFWPSGQVHISEFCLKKSEASILSR